MELANLQKIIEHIAMATKKKKYAEFQLLLQKWRPLKEIIYLLKIPYEATLELQSRKLTLSDTFGIWLQVKLHLKKVIDAKVSKVGLDVKLLEGMNSRNNHIFDHPAMKAALYLDPRYRSEVTKNPFDVNDAKEFIIQLKQRLDHCKGQVATNESIADEGDSDESIGIQFDAEAAINDYLGINQTFGLGTMSNFEADLDTFDPPILSIRKSVLEYWNEPNDYDSLRDVANALCAIPPTETEVERDFSALKFIFSDHRGSLSNKTLENILCIHLNKDIYLDVNEKEIKKLEKTL